MDSPESHTSPTSNNANKRPPIGRHTASTASADSETIHKILRLFPSSFCFPRHTTLFQRSHRQSIHTALGAVNRQGRAGKQSTVLKRVTLVFRLAIQTHLFYPSYNLETKTFWATVLADVREEEPLIEHELDAAALAEVVGVYTQAYADAHGEEDENDGDDDNSGFDAAFELLTPKKGNIDPRKKLVSLVRMWAKLFRIHKLKMAPKSTTITAAAAATNKPDHQVLKNNTASTSAIPNQLPSESDAAYITRLQTTIKCSTTAEKAAQETITELQRSQVLADDHHKNHNARLHATIDRMDAKIKDLERELRLEKMGAGGGGEDDPWVPWRDYAGHLDGGL